MHLPSFRRLFLAVCLCLAFFGGFQAPPARSAVMAALPDPLVAGMLAQVQDQAVGAYTGSLSGEWPVNVEGGQYLFTTRTTGSGTPIQKATQYVYDHFQAWGLSSSFASWATGIYSSRNVIGSLPGQTTPSEIILLTAHIDDASGSGRAPGADDNASGSVGVLLAAEILSQYRFERTIRFVFFTGEEQGLYGSSHYALDAHNSGDKIVGVVNLDMIGWDVLDGPVTRLHIRNPQVSDSAKDLAIAQTFVDVVTTYGLGLQPVIAADGMGRSDHASFWSQGYPAMLAIEDDRDDFNRYYHSSNDRLIHLRLDYFNSFIKAAVGTVANLAHPLGKSTNSYNARIEPPAAMQWGDPAQVITYPVRITNTGSLADTYTLDASGNAWPMDFPAQVGPLAAGASADVPVTVTIPADTPGGTADISRLRVNSNGKGTGVDALELTTETYWRIVFLPLIIH